MSQVGGLTVTQDTFAQAPSVQTGGASYANLTDDQIVAQIRQTYGYESWLLDVPELRTVLLDATRGGWDTARVQGALQATNWWKQHSDTQRQWLEEKSNDPASAAQQLRTVEGNITAEARKLGVNIGPDRIAALAETAQSNGWDSTQLSQAVEAEYHYTPDSSGNRAALAAAQQGKPMVDPTTGRPAWTGPNGEPGYAPGDKHMPVGAVQWKMPDGRTAWYVPHSLPRGDVATDLQRFQSLAKDYMVPMSDATVNLWVQQAVSGQTDEAGFVSYLKEQAKSLFPGMGAAIDAGITPGQYTQPYKQLAAQTLDINPESIDMMDPKWMKAIMQVDPKTGARTSMSLSDWQNELRANPAYGYQNTNAARTQAYDMASQLAKGLGAIA